MGWFIILGMLAAFGLVCVFWVVTGVFLPGQRGTLIYWGEDALTAAQRYVWLREMGLETGRLTVLDCSGPEREWLLAHGIEIGSREELIRILQMGEKEIDAGT